MSSKPSRTDPSIATTTQDNNATRFNNMQVPFLSLHDVTAMHGDEIREAARRVIDSGWYLQGKENEAFEQHYADYIGSPYCIGCANGLDALIWIFRAYIELGVM